DMSQYGLVEVGADVETKVSNPRLHGRFESLDDRVGDVRVRGAEHVFRIEDALDHLVVLHVVPTDLGQHVAAGQVALPSELGVVDPFLGGRRRSAEVLQAWLVAAFPEYIEVLTFQRLPVEPDLAGGHGVVSRLVRGSQGGKEQRRLSAGPLE